MSSDSDDDVYNNAAKMLQNLRKQYFEEYLDKNKALSAPPETDNKISESAPTCDSVTNNDGEDSFSIDDLLEKHSNIKKKTTRKGIKTHFSSESDYSNDSECKLYNTTNQRKRKICRRSRRLSNKSKRVSKIAKQLSNMKPDSETSVITITETTPEKIKKGKTTKKRKSKKIITNDSNNSSEQTINGHIEQISNGGMGESSINNMLQLTRGLENVKRGVARGTRGRRARTRILHTTVPSYQPEQYPTINIGNCEEYPDNSADIQLFSSRSKVERKNEVIVLDDDLDENEELSVKVHWRNFEVCRFNIRKFQKLKEIFEYFSKKENVSQQQLLFTYNDSIIKCDDTPDSIGYNIAKFIDGGIINHNINVNKEENPSNGIRIKFQCQNSKKPLEITVDPDDKLALAFFKCAEHFETLPHKIKFEFDGEIIAGTSTSREMEFEGGECIDVTIFK